MTPAATLRAAARALESACHLAQQLPPSAVGAEEAMALAFDAPRVILALAVIAGTLDPAGEVADIECNEMTPERIAR